MIIAFYILGSLLFIFIIGKAVNEYQFRTSVAKLFSLSQNNVHKNYQLTQIQHLPAPVQSYFKHVLPENQSYISHIRMTHNGQFKTGQDKDWINIKGEHYATTQNPGFIWKGNTSLFTATDSYIQNTGNLKVSLLSIINIIDAKGPAYNQGELIRWLGESVIYPTNLLPSENLSWSAIDTKTAKLNFNYNGLNLYFIVKFNEKGEIIELETKRYMEINQLETWVIKLNKYKKMNHILVPTSFEVLWRLPKGDFSYAKFYIQKLEYNKPFIF